MPDPNQAELDLDPSDPESAADAESATPHPFWSGTLSFGLVSIPVDLFAGTRSNRVSLRMLGPNGTPLARRYYSPSAEKQLAPEQMVRAYEVQPGQYVTVTNEELERLEPEKSRDIQLRQFVDAATIPAIYLERSYFLTPAGNSNRAYRLLAATMAETGRAAIATFVMRGKEYLIAIFSENGVLQGETLRFNDEIRTPADVGLPEPADVDAKFVAAFKKFLETKASDKLDEDDLRDSASRKLLDFVNSKRSQANAVVRKEPEKERAEVIDILEVLKRSLAQQRPGAEPPAAPQRRTAPRKTKRPA